MPRTGRRIIRRAAGSLRSPLCVKQVDTIWFLACEPWLWLVVTWCGFRVVKAAPLDAWGRVLVDGSILAVAAGAAARRLPSRAHPLQRELGSRLRATKLHPRRLRPQTFSDWRDVYVRDVYVQAMRDAYDRAMEAPGRLAKSIVGFGFASFFVLLQARIAAHMLYVDHRLSAVLVGCDVVIASLDVFVIVHILVGRVPLARQPGSVVSYPSCPSSNQPTPLLSIPLALLTALIVLLWETFWFSHGSAAWRSATFLASFLGLTWSSRKALVPAFSALERITSRLWPAYAAAYRWLWGFVRCAKVALTATLIIALPAALEFSIDTPPATMHVAQALSTVLVALWGYQLMFGWILRDWRRPSTVKPVTAAKAYNVLAEGPVAELITFAIWGVAFVLAIWLVTAA